MRYYKHKTTGEIIGVTGGLRDLIDGNGNVTACITEVVLPNKWLGNGIISHMMSFTEIQKWYKRTNRKEAFAMYPDFGQWRHIDDVRHNISVTYYGSHYLNELIPMREHGFGTPFTKEGKEKRELFQTILN